MKNFKEIEAFVFDMDGTIYTGDTPIPHAAETLRVIKARGKRVCYFTNNSSRCGEEYVVRLRKLGFPAELGDVITSGDVALHYLTAHHSGKRVIVFGTPSLRECFAGRVTLDDENPEVAVMGFHNRMTYAELVTFCNALRRGIPFLATHPDKNCPAEPLPVPDCGSFLSLVETSTGRIPEAVCGKPSILAGEFLTGALNVPAERIAFVGDRYSTDILLAKNNGFASVHVLTGAHEEDEGEPADLVLDTVNDLLQFV